MNEQEIKQTILNILQPVEQTETRAGMAYLIVLVVGIGLAILTYTLGLSSSFYYGIFIACGILCGVVVFYSEPPKERAFKSYCEAFPPNSAERGAADRILSSLDEPKLAANAFRERLKVKSMQEGTSEGRKQQAIAEIISKPEAKIHFRMPSVILDEHPSSKTEKPIGDLYFTSRGLFFVQLGMAPAKSRVPGMLLGIGGQVVVGAIHANKVQAARNALRPEGETVSANELAKQLETAEVVRVFRCDSILDITESIGGFNLKTVGATVEFGLANRKETFQAFDDSLMQYLAAVWLPNLDKNGSLQNHASRNGIIVADLQSQERITSSSEGKSNLVVELERLSILKNQGVLTEDEFTAAKRKVIG